ncbi:MAG: 16S rRNA (cytosine(1402)-N(4))-methyltransferase RsmH, partial [bacterium]
WLIDQDSTATEALETRFEGDQRVRVRQDNFGSLDWQTLPPFDIILIDLGVSSAQLDTADRGFSFRYDGPLDMRMDRSQAMSAFDLINKLDQAELADTIWRYGEEPRSRKIAEAIVKKRGESPIRTTKELLSVIHATIGEGGRINSATKTFQALRIAVNDELGALERVIPQATNRLKPGGRLLIISFHSLEDRIVKQAFQKLTKPETDPITGQPITIPSFSLVTKKPQIAAPDEIDTNPRARSAKLRAVEKQN